MSRIEDVARVAGVSAMTVSRVINNSSKVSEKTKQKVNKAIKELKYQPNPLARGLAQGHTYTLAYIVPDISNPYFGEIMKGAEKASEKEGFSVLYFSAATEEALDRIMQIAIRRSIDGVAFHDLDPTDAQLNSLIEAGISCILIENEKIKKSKDFSTIDFDYEAEAKCVGEVFLKQGYTQVACVHGSTKPIKENGKKVSRRHKQRRIWKERYNGFTSVFKNHKNIKILDYEMDFSEDEDIIKACEKVSQSLRKHLDKPLAVYCTEDMIALGVRGYMLEHRIDMPSKIAIFGTDGLDEATTYFPRISTVVHPRRKLGEMAIAELVATARDKYPHKHEVITEHILFCGDTTYDFNKEELHAIN